MKTPDDQLLARWLDGELSADERTRFEAMMAADPVLREEAESMRQLGELLRAHVVLDRPVPNADFFNSQIQEQIAADQRAEERSKVPAVAGAGTSWWGWFRSPWMLVGAAAMLAVGLLVFQTDQGPQTQVLSFYAPKQGIQASAYHNHEAGATVLLLDGLEAIPAEREIVGMNVHHSQTDAEVATTTLFGTDGGILLVMSQDAASKPLLMGR